MSKRTLKDFMKPQHKASLEGLPTYHSHCFERTGVCRPGKTARERAKRAEREKKHREQSS